MYADPLRLTQHLHWRTGMGLRPKELEEISAKPYEQQVKDLFRASEPFVPLRADHRTSTQQQYRVMKEPEQFKFRRASRLATFTLNTQWRQRLIGPSSLREKMALFWHGHFASWSHWSISTEQYINLLREHALGDFRTLLKAVSRSASMLEFLSNQRNRKDAPNENFAREVMELFTLGRGQYSETDIHEAARAFTGWAFHLEDASFWFREEHHDFGTKTFRGKTGNFNGDDILELILEDKRTAEFISRKIYRWFVNPEVDEDFVKVMAERFYVSGYAIGDLMRFVFTSAHFKDARHFGCRIKSPVELLCGMDRQFAIRFEQEKSAIVLQRMLGQLLLYPPNVAGWKEGTSWIDSNALMLRLKLPSVLLNGGELQWDGEEDSPQDNDLMMGGMFRMEEGNGKGKGTGRRLRTIPDTSAFLGELPTNTDNSSLCDRLLVVPPSGALQANLSRGAVFERVLEILSSPEYQLC